MKLYSIMKTTKTSERQVTQLVDFRQQIYNHLSQRRDAQFELLDALLQRRWVDCLVELSLAPSFHRKWPSVYSALEEGRQKRAKLHKLCLSQIPFREIEHFVIDASSVRRSSSPTLEDRSYVHSATHDVGSKGIVVGHEHSILAWSEKTHSSWSLAVQIERIDTNTEAVTVACEQIKWLCENAPKQSRCRVALDGKYGNKHFFALSIDNDCDLIARLRKDRVMYQAPSAYKGIGRPPKYGAAFRFKDPETWHQPDETEEFDDERYGRVKLQLWRSLRFEYGKKVVEIDVLRAAIHTDKEKPPEPRWYGWHGSDTAAEEIWRTFHYRWPVEPSIRFRKEHLHWQLPQTRTIAASERWTMLVSLAQWQLYLARDLVADCRLPWQKELTDLTPARVRQSLDSIFPTIGTPASAPQTRGKSLGWPKGKARAKPPRYKVIKKETKNMKKPKLAV